MAREQDHYTKRALQEGYPARSVYKLEEIQNRFGIIGKGARVLDIGASPGSFSMYALKAAGAGSVVAVDLKNEAPPLPGNRFTFLQGDAFSEPVISMIREHGPYHCVLSDAAPSTTGNRTVDTARSFNLARQAISLACGVLVPSGNIVVKVFQSGEEKELLDALKTSFTSARMVKPKASRKESFEVFLVATGYRGPHRDH
ncbi:MAG: RlmE family RNA methyltransferase [Spirochaetales bacterium]|nr:RlmE family RNA methyltransferase [Spirochaetales bacterium]